MPFNNESNNIAFIGKMPDILLASDKMNKPIKEYDQSQTECAAAVRNYLEREAEIDG